MKPRLRAKKLLERQQHHPEQQKSKNLKILGKIGKLPAFKKAKTVAFYLPIHGEVDLTPLLHKFGKKTFVLPRVKGKSLELHAVKSLEHTVRGKFNILEPHSHLPKIKPQDLDLLFIPGVVFAENGHRIGYGKGHYDRLLKKTLCPKIGIAYGFQMVKNIPGEPHDVPMDMIITERKTFKISR